MAKKQENENLDLSLTMQQKFNFDSNNLEEENILLKKSNSKKNDRIKEIINIKNMYKRKYKIVLIISIILFILFLGISIAYLFIKPKELVKEIKTPVMDENIVFVGDSLTELYDLNKYYNDYHIVNSGVGGNSTRDVLDNLEKRVYQYNPSKVFLLIGTNDMAYQYPKEEIYTNIVKIVNEIKKNRPYAKIYVQSIYPINNSYDPKIRRKSVTYRKNEIVNYINDKLKEKYKNTDVIYVDVNKKLLDEDNLLNIDYTVDGVHISDEGYKKITSVLLPYIKK